MVEKTGEQGTEKPERGPAEKGRTAKGSAAKGKTPKKGAVAKAKPEGGKKKSVPRKTAAKKKVSPKPGKTAKTKAAEKSKPSPPASREVRGEEGQLSGFDGTLLRTYSWEPEDFKAAFLVVHGFGEHAGRYGFFRDYFLPRGYAVYSMDNRGHGQSAGRRGHVKRYDDYIEDLRLRVFEVLRSVGLRKLFLVGHSNGGLIALRYALKYPDNLAGVVVSGPLLELAMPVPSWKSALGKVSAYIAPTLTMANELVPERLSRDEEVQRAYMTDPLVHHVVSSRWFVEMQKAARDARERAGDFQTPLLLLHGEDDELCGLSATRRFYHKVNRKDVRIETYEGFRHEIFNEIGKEKVFADIEEWIASLEP